MLRIAPWMVRGIVSESCLLAGRGDLAVEKSERGDCVFAGNATAIAAFAFRDIC